MNTLTNDTRLQEEATNKESVKKEELAFSPAVNIYETKENVTLILEMPGVDPSSVNLSVEKDTLLVEGNLVLDTSEYGKPAILEFSPGKYLRKFTLGKFVDAEKAVAKMNNGYLEIKIPKVEPKKTKIEIQS
jgi:HSP20 family protein